MVPRPARTAAALIAAALAMISLANCSPPAPGAAGNRPSAQPPQPLPTDSTPLRIRLEHAAATVIVEPDGSWTYTAQAGQAQHGRLTEAQAAELWLLANNPNLAPEAKPGGSPAACTGGREYTMTLGEDRQLQAVDCGNLPPTLRSLVQFLREATPFT